MTTNSETKPTILIVEDNEINSNVLQDYLSDRYNVLVADNGITAIDTIYEKRNELSLVLLDIVLPDINGFEILEEMNENGWIEFLPVVVISSEGSEEFKSRAYLNNVYGFITKPFTYEEVMACIKNILPQ